jgi:thioredoxin reductase
MSYHDYIIVGAGAAGLQMGYFMEQAGRDYLILEGKDGPGSFFRTQPRHGELLSINKRYNWFPEPDFNLRHDWNSLITNDFSHLFKDYSAELFPQNTDMVRYLEDFAKKYVSNIQYDTKITRIDREAGGAKHFILTSSEGKEYRCARLLMASGTVKPYIPDIEGIEYAEGYEDFDTNRERFINKRVVILGGVNSAFEVANDLAGHAAIIFIMVGNRLLKHAWNTHFVGDLRSVNDTILDMFQLKLLHNVYGANLTKLTKEDDGTLRVYYEEELPHWNTPGTATGWFPVDYVIRCTGWKYADPEIFTPEIKPAVDAKKKYPILSTMWESSVPDMYFMGTVMSARDRKSASGFIHGFRYHVRTLFHQLCKRYHDTPVPSDKFVLKNEADLLNLGAHLVTRLSTTSALYQLFGMMCDVLVLSDGQAEMYYELPAEHVLSQPEFTENKRIIIFTLELGFNSYPANHNALNFVRRNDPERSGCAVFLHPAFRYYENGQYIKGSNTRSSQVIRYDQAAGIFDGDLANEKPRNVILNFINGIVKVTSEAYPEEHFCNDDRGGFTPWAADDPRIPDHPLPRCAREVGGPQVDDFMFRTDAMKTM